MTQGLLARTMRVLRPCNVHPAARESLLALALEGQTVRGARLVRGRGGWSSQTVGAWPVTAPAEGAATAESDPSGLGAALASAAAAAPSEALALGLPTALLLLRVLRLPSMEKDELDGAVALQMDKLSPFPGDELTVGWEALSSGSEETVVLAAAVPGHHLEAVSAALATARLRVARTDVALLGWWRALREQAGVLGSGTERQALLVAAGTEWDLLVLDAGVPVLVRGMGQPLDEADLARELTLSLLQAEMEAGARPLEEVTVVAAEPPAEALLEALRACAAPAVVRAVAPAGSAADGVGRRAVEGAGIDLTPASWRARELAAETRRRLTIGLAAAAGLWLALAATLFVAPVATQQLVQWQKDKERAILPDYRRVSDMRERINLIRRYMDRNHSLLESLRTITQQQPEGLELSSLTYRREEGCKLAGEAPDPGLIYQFKEKLQSTAPFASCRLGGVSIIAGSQKQRFEMDALFEEAP